MEDAIVAWEDEGGSSARTGEHQMIGTVNQIAWAVQIKAQVDAEFDRVRKVFESVATKQSPNDKTDIQAIISNPRRQTRGSDGKRTGRVFHPGLAGVAGSGPPVNYWRSQVQGDQGQSGGQIHVAAIDYGLQRSTKVGEFGT